MNSPATGARRIQSRRFLRAPSPGTRLGVIAIIASATALALGWALYLPMFLSPDEDSHYDYALTLHTAGRAMRAPENVQGRDTHPSVEYLVSTTRVRQMRLDPNVRADAGYGTRAYVAKLDAGAPQVDADRYRAGPIVPVPYISRLYPIGYYGLVAGAIALADAAGPVSIVREFYFARFLSVALLPITLFFTWLSLRELRLGDRRSLLLLAAVAFLPLTAWMAGCVQPDNLACALIAATIYGALRLRREPFRFGYILVLGILLAALIATKRHYFAAVFVPVISLAAARLASPFDWRKLLGTLALLTLPAIIAFAATEPSLQTLPGATGVCLLGGQTPSLSERLMTAAAGLQGAFRNTFLYSSGPLSFWITYSAYTNAPIIIGTFPLTVDIIAALIGLTVVVAALFVVKLVKNGVRLVRVARRRSILSAARVATSNVLVNSYLCFFIILWGFEAYSGGLVTIQGRYWLPFLAAIWFITVQLAPQALPRRLGRAVSAVLLIFVLTYDLAATAYAFPSIHDRFYGPPGPIVPDLDVYARFSDAKQGQHYRFNLGSVKQGHVLAVDGVALDMRSAAGSRQVHLIIDGKTPVAAVAVDRPDMECNTEKTARNSGFHAVIDTSGVAKGEHTLSIEATVDWAPAPIDGGARATFDVK